MSSRRFTRFLLTALVAASTGLPPLMPAARAADISQVPLFVTQSADPLVMFTMSNDHQLYVKAYTDYDDVDDDGAIDTGYDDAVDYYGYFDPDKCYVYSATNGRFEPSATAPAAGTHECAGSTLWSGNFLNWGTMTRMDVLRKVLYGGYRKDDSGTGTVLERSYLPRDIHSFAKVFRAASAADMEKFTPYSSTAVTLCNTNDNATLSQNDTSAPQIKVADGAYPLWAANEVRQCQTGSSALLPDATDVVATLNARVQVCVSGLEEDNCKQYFDNAGSATNKKPIGLLQTYGEAADGPALRFGLLTGSYRRNLSGGILHKNIVRFADSTTASDNEVDTETGIFTGNPGIVDTIDRFRVSGWQDNVYTDCNTHSIAPNELVEDSTTRNCSNWGNPVGEMYLETLRYFSGGASPSPTAAFNTDDSSKIPNLATASWNDPYTSDTWCAQPSTIIVSTGLNSFDDDQYGSASDIEGLSGAGDVSALTDKIGAAEGIHGNSWFIGENGTLTNGTCDAKTVTALSTAKGLCPEIPNQRGGFKVAGLAYHSRITNLRPDITPINEEIRMSNYALSLAQGLPTFTVNGVTFLPACTATPNGTKISTCSLADLRIVGLQYSGADLVAGNLLVQWEDSSWGNDYDLDGMERIEFCTGAGCSAAILAAAGLPSLPPDQILFRISSPYSNAGNELRFGLAISGSAGNDGLSYPVIRDGGRNRFCVANDLTTLTTCSGDTDGNWESDSTKYPHAIFTVTRGAAGAGQLEPPLWYAAKYGGFTDQEATPNDLPDQASEWDTDGDGDPDNYFAVTNPASLVRELNTVFSQVVKTKASAASVVANSVTLETNTFIYQAQFNSGNWIGDLIAYAINADGSLGAIDWQARDGIDGQDYDTGREIITYDPTQSAGSRGVPFRWASLNAGQQAALNLNPVTLAPDGRGAQRLDYLRGDRSLEADQTGGVFRTREEVLGDIVNSTPFFVGAPAFPYPDAIHAATGDELYSTFVANNANRKPIIYVGANDGMLHGIDADPSATSLTKGEEVLAYVPDAVFDGLNELTAPTYNHRFFVNGSPAAIDAFFSDQRWHTVLVGGLGAGGKGYFALDVTDPSAFGEGQAQNIALWEFTDADDADMGFSYGQPSIAKMANGQWAAIVSNGYHSATGKAVLYVLDAETGALIYEFDPGSGTTGDPNGMSTPSAVDSDGDFVIDYIYAGDLKGNIWKVDVQSSNPNQWGSAYKSGNSPAPLFQAVDSGGTPQPITTRIEVALNPHGSGLMVYAGTGKYFEEGDDDPTGAQVQSMYGIIDDNSKVNRSQLLEQTIDWEGALTFDTRLVEIRVTSDHDINNEDGWYMDLVYAPSPTEGERVVVRPILNAGRIIFTTLIPSTLPCDAGGTGWLMELASADGGRLEGSPFDLNNDGQIDVKDLTGADLDGDGVIDKLPVSGKKSEVGIIQAPTIIKAGTVEYKYASGSKGGQIEVIRESAADQAAGRMSWQQLR